MVWQMGQQGHMHWAWTGGVGTWAVRHGESSRIRTAAPGAWHVSMPAHDAQTRFYMGPKEQPMAQPCPYICTHLAAEDHQVPTKKEGAASKGGAGASCVRHHMTAVQQIIQHDCTGADQLLQELAAAMICRCRPLAGGNTTWRMLWR